MVYNPYYSQPSEALQILPTSGKRELLRGPTMPQGDEMLLILLILLLIQDGSMEDRWPLVAALFYCLI